MLWLWDVTRWPIVPMSDLSLVIRSSSPQNLLHNWRGASLQTFTWEIPRCTGATHWLKPEIKKVQKNKINRMALGPLQKQLLSSFSFIIRITMCISRFFCIFFSSVQCLSMWPRRKTLKLVLNCHNLSSGLRAQWMQFSCQRDTFTIHTFWHGKWQSYQNRSLN